MNSVYLLTGGNVGDRLSNLSTAADHIHRMCGPVIKSSAVYETAPWGNSRQPPFLNQVLLVQTSLPAQKLLNNILKIEAMMGRKRDEKYGPRLIDIDLLFFNTDIIRLPNLHVPHPEMTRRRFVMQPLADIASEFIHPELQIPVKTLLEQCEDNLDVKKFFGG